MFTRFQMKPSGCIRILFLFLAILLAGSSYAQVKPKSRKEQQKELRKKKEEQIKKQNRAESGLKKRHMDIQDKATKRRMKKAKKKSNKLNKSKRR
jgi:flagellar biosynthesis component FlhA